MIPQFSNGRVNISATFSRWSQNSKELREEREKKRKEKNGNFVYNNDGDKRQISDSDVEFTIDFDQGDGPVDVRGHPILLKILCGGHSR